MTFELRDAIGLYNAVNTTLCALWSLYIVVSFGMLGFIFGKESSGGMGRLTNGLLTVGFIAFAMANGRAIARNQGILHASTCAIKRAIQDTNSPIKPEWTPLLAKLDSASETSTVFLYILVSIFVVTAMWIHPTIRWKRKNGVEGSESYPQMGH